MKKSTGTIISILLSIIVFSVCFFSCGLKSTASHFTDQLVLSDSYIQQGNTDKALKLLKSMLKKADSDYEFLGLYKRFKIIGYISYAQKSLENGLKKNIDSKPLLAVKVSLLLDEQNFKDAVSVAKPLIGTKYDSLYAEAILQQTKNSESGNDFLDEALAPSYDAAFRITGNSAWSLNAAITFAKSGNYNEAFKRHPINISKYDDPYFWGIISYDSGNLVQAISDFDLISDTQEGLLLKADAYILSGEDAMALSCWQKAIEMGPTFSPVMYVNTARSSMLLSDEKTRRDALVGVVSSFPDYIPGLVEYGRFALETSVKSPDDALTAALRSGGRQTIAMRLDDERPKIPVSDALHKMEQSLQYKNDASLLVEYTKLRWANNESLQNVSPTEVIDGRKKIVEMWEILEKNMTGVNEYPPYLVRFAVWLFLSQRRDDDAFRLFENHLAQRYNFQAFQNTSQSVIEFAEKFELWECEYCAWFLMSQGKYNKAVALYEYLLDGYNKNFPELANGSEFVVPSSALLNLGLIYSSAMKSKEALALYSRASGRTSNPIDRSEIQYRIASIQVDKKDFTSAQAALEYSIILNPNNTKARLLLKKIRG